jgi:hypothetical protein
MEVAVRILLLLLAVYVGAIAVGRVPKRKTIRGARFTAAGRAAVVQIAASQHLNNAWTPRAASAAIAK